jgi:FHA domain
MRERRQKRIWLSALSLLLFGLLFSIPALAQEAASQLIITGTDASSAPTIEIQLYALDGQGNVVTLSAEDLIIRHAGETVTNVEVVGSTPVGTLAVFVIDIPSGVSSQIPTIQTAIQQYATEANMLEQVDYVAVFRVDELAANQILAPSEFFNSILNAFANPLEPTSGATALIDSIMGIMNNIDSIKPSPELATHLVVFSDGTDAVSTQFEDQDVPKLGAQLGIPIHTVVLDNADLDGSKKQDGRQYLSQVASGTGGRSTILSTAEELVSIWGQIASFRDHQLVRYTIDDLGGGDLQIEVSLASNPEVTMASSVTIPPGAPSIVINLPQESRQLTLPVLDAPVPLSFSTTVSWLDGVERSVTKAQLLVNGLIIQEIAADQLENFDAQISNFVYGENSVQVAIVDDQGNRATSPEIVLTVSEGETVVIPQEVEPTALTGRIWDRIKGPAIWVGGCLGLIVAIVVLVVLYRVVRGSKLARSLGLSRLLYRIPFLKPYMREARQVQRFGRQGERMKRQMGRYSPDVKSTDRSKKGTGPNAFLEVVESMTRRSGRIELTSVEMKIGRSAKQADIVFNKDGTVSRIHASIVQEGNDFRIFDEQSTSGTFVNEQRVPEYGLQLDDGDEIRLGGVRLRFRDI